MHFDLAILVITFLTYVSAESTCKYLGFDHLQCKYCGYQGSAPIQCIAQKAKFDDLTKGSEVGAYPNQWGNFSNFVVAASAKGKSHSLATDTAPYFAKAPQGRGILFPSAKDPDSDQNFGYGNLRNFYFSCTKVNTQDAVPCDLKIKATCLNITDGLNPTLYSWSSTLKYAANETTDGKTLLQYADWDPVSSAESEKLEQKYPNQELCTTYCQQYDFDASQASKTVDLYIDTVIYNGNVEENF